LAMRKGEATRTRIVEETGRQAAIRGFGAVSLNDVAEAVGLSKSGLFKHFDSKEDMSLAALDQGFDRFLAFNWGDADSLPAGRPRLEAVFDHWLDWTEVENAAGGCLINQAAVELDDQPGPLRDLLKIRIGRWRARLKAEFMSLRTPPISGAEADSAVFQMKSFILGHSEQRRLLDDDGARAAARAAFRALLDRTAGV
jgi:AcrR family transcriptional regulator